MLKYILIKRLMGRCLIAGFCFPAIGREFKAKRIKWGAAPACALKGRRRRRNKALRESLLSLRALLRQAAGGRCAAPHLSACFK